VIASGVMAQTNVLKEPVECFSNTGIYGAAIGKAKSDLDVINLIKKDSVITAFKVCTNSANSSVVGCEVTYGRYDEAGDLTEETLLDTHGITKEESGVSC